MNFLQGFNVISVKEMKLMNRVYFCTIKKINKFSYFIDKYFDIMKRYLFRRDYVETI